MRGFSDEVLIEVSSGKGGAGCVSFRREKYVPRGGPDGGDGGRGGDLLFVVKANLKTLSHLRYRKVYAAGNGQPGAGRRRHGLDGANALIEVPPGTVIKDPETGEIIADLTEQEQFLFLKGGKGGKGNFHYKTSVNQAPTYAQPGLPGEARFVKVELNLIADIGLVGFPNAGKSSLLDIITNAKPEIADYPFTTKIPNLGVLREGSLDIVIADIPGIIEGASEGAGLGIRFLKHIARTRILLFMIDLSQDNYLDAFEILLNELSSFSPELASRKRIVAGTKLDLYETEGRLDELKAKLPNETVFGFSSFTHEGLPELKQMFTDILKMDEVEST